MDTQVTVSFLRDLSPFLAIVISAIALTIGPAISGRVSRAQMLAQMREKWIYSFRDLLVQITTELDVAVEKIGEEGLVRSHTIDGYVYDYIERLRKHQNSIRLMVNIEESAYKELVAAIDGAVHPLIHGIKSYDDLYRNIEQVKVLGQKALAKEWARVSP